MRQKKRLPVSMIGFFLILLSCLIVSPMCLMADEPPLQVVVNIDPDTLNFKSKGKWITAYLVAGQYYTWQHGFLPGGDPLNHPDVTTNIGHEWYSYESPDLMKLIPGQHPVTRMWNAVPEVIIGVEVGGNGWDFHGRVDNVSLYGIIASSPTGNLLRNGDFSDGFNCWIKTSWKNINNPSQFFWNIEAQDGTPAAPCFDYKRTNSGSDGGWIGLFQKLRQHVDGWDSLKVSYNVKIVSNTLNDSGWWWTVYGGWGETPGRIVVHYLAHLNSGDIDVSSIKLYGIDIDNDGEVDFETNLPVVGPSDLEDNTLMVKFDRQRLIEALLQARVPNNSIVGLVVTGNYKDGTPFSAFDRIRILTK